MQVQKDVLIAGGVVVVCVALVVVALVATGKHDKTPAIADNGGLGTTSGMDAPAPAPYPGDSGFGGNGGNGGSSFGAPQPGGFGGSPLATPPPAPAPTPDPGLGLGGPSPLPAPGPGPLAGGPLEPTPAPAPAPAPAPLPGDAAGGHSGGGTHVVAKGETLSDISMAAYGTSKHWRKIVEANPGLDPVRLKTGQVVNLPVIEAAAPAPGGPAAGGAGTYTVAKGDSYYTIAKKELGSAARWREIERLNNVPAEDLKVGTVLKIPAKDAGAPGAPGAPAGGGKTHIVAKGETLGDISKQYFGTTTKWKAIVEANPGVKAENLKVGQSLAIPDLPVAAPAPGAPVGAGAGAGTYTVKTGDTLETIAAAQLGKKSAWKQIVEANPGLKPNALRAGQQIVIPGGTGSPAPAPAPAPVPGVSAPAPAPGFGGPAPAPAPGAPAPAPAPPAPSDDLFYNPYENKPAPGGAPAAPAPAGPGAPFGSTAGSPSALA